MKKVIHSFITGIAFGAVTYLVLITMGLQPYVPSVWNTFSVLLISGMIGVSSLIMDLEMFNWSVGILSHLVVTLFLVWSMMKINNWPFSWMVFAIVLIVYVIIWSVIRIQEWSDIKKVNTALNQRKNDSHL
jgi:Na+/glutamate symporter